MTRTEGSEDSFYIRNQQTAEVGLGGYFGSKRIGVEGHGWKMVTKKTIIADKYENDLFGDEKIDMGPARRYYERWRYLRKVGIPSVSNMKVLDNDNIIMADDTRDGNVLFDKHYSQRLNLYAIEGRELTKIEEMFLEINPEEIKKEILKIQDIAWQNGFVLPSDSEWFVINFRPDGSWQIEVRDLSYLHKIGKADKKDIEMKWMFDSLDEMRRILKKVGEKFKMLNKT